MRHLYVRPNGYPESKMVAKSKMASPSSNPNISTSFQLIWIKICVHRQIQVGFPIFKSKYLSQFSTDLDQNLRAPPLGQA